MSPSKQTSTSSNSTITGEKITNTIQDYLTVRTSPRPLYPQTLKIVSLGNALHNLNMSGKESEFELLSIIMNAQNEKKIDQSLLNGSIITILGSRKDSELFHSILQDIISAETIKYLEIIDPSTIDSQVNLASLFSQQNTFSIPCVKDEVTAFAIVGMDIDSTASQIAKQLESTTFNNPFANYGNYFHSAMLRIVTLPRFGETLAPVLSNIISVFLRKHITGMNLHEDTKSALIIEVERSFDQSRIASLNSLMKDKEISISKAVVAELQKKYNESKSNNTILLAKIKSQDALVDELKTVKENINNFMPIAKGQVEVEDKHLREELESLKKENFLLTSKLKELEEFNKLPPLDSLSTTSPVNSIPTYSTGVGLPHNAKIQIFWTIFKKLVIKRSLEISKIDELI